MTKNKVKSRTSESNKNISESQIDKMEHEYFAKLEKIMDIVFQLGNAIDDTTMVNLLKQ